MAMWRCSAEHNVISERVITRLAKVDARADLKLQVSGLT
jgi:hypothetical protein